MTLLLLLSFWNALLAQTHPKTCDPKDNRSCVQPLMEGEEAPFFGQLLTPRRAARLAIKAEQCQTRIDLSVQETKQLYEFDLDLARQLRANDRQAAEMQKKILSEELARAHEAAETNFLDHPVTWMIIGGALVGAAVGIATAIISETRPQLVTTP